jgi:galactokinase
VNNKAASARTQYNLRVLETLAGARALAHALGVPVDADPARHAAGTHRERVTLREVLGRWLGEGADALPTDALKDGLERLLAGEIEKLKPASGSEDVGLDEMVQMCGLERAEFEEVYLRWADADAERFELYKRTKHVASEALRVLAFREACLTGPSPPSLQTIG